MFKATVIETSIQNLTAKDKLQLTDTTDCVKLDDATRDGELVLDIADYARIKIENDKSDDKEYENYMIIAKDGTKYITGSTSFWSGFRMIFDTLADEGELDTDWQLKVYRVPSKNYKDKDFITCSIL